MLVHSYLLVIFVLLEWSFSRSFVITENLPQENDLQEKLMEYLRKIKWRREHRWDAFKNSIKTWRKKKKGLKFCKLWRAQQQYLCRIILRSEKYNIPNIDEKQTKKCKKMKIRDSGQLYSLKMVACVPESPEDPLYLLSATDENQPSLYLFRWEKAGEAADTDRLHLEAKILLSDSNLRDLKFIKKREFSKKLDKIDDWFYEPPSSSSEEGL